MEQLIPSLLYIGITEIGEGKTVVYEYKDKITNENAERVVVTYSNLSAENKLKYDAFVNMIDSLNS